MHRIQIQLTEEQERALRELSRLRQESISALIREGIDRMLEPEAATRAAKRDRAFGLIGILGSESPGDLAEHHDRYLADAIYDHITGNRP